MTEPRKSEWTDGVEQADGGWIFPDTPMTADVVSFETQYVVWGDDRPPVMQCRAVYRS